MKVSKLLSLFVCFALMPVCASSEHRIGEYIPLEAITTPDSLTGNEDIRHESYEFYGNSITDTNLDEKSQDYLGTVENAYPVPVLSISDTEDISSPEYPDLYQFRQQLVLKGSDISLLFRQLKDSHLPAAERTGFISAWDDVLRQYAEILAGITDNIDIRQAALNGFPHKTIREVLGKIPELSVLGDEMISVDTNTDPGNQGKDLKDIFTMMANIGRKNQEQAKKTADEIRQLLSGRSFAGTQIVGRTDLYNPSYIYEGNVMTLEIVSRGSTSGAGGEVLKTWYETDEAGNIYGINITSTEQAREHGGDVFARALETIQIDYTPENSARLRAMQAEIDSMDDGDQWHSLMYPMVLTTFEKYFPEYDTSAIWKEFDRVIEEKTLRSGVSDSNGLVNIVISSPETPGLVTDSDISSSTASTFDSAIFLLMGEESGESGGSDAAPSLISPTDLVTEDPADRNALIDRFLQEYVISAGYECLTTYEITDQYPHDALAPNEDIYDIDEKYTGSFGSLRRLFKGNFPAYNKLTGSYEYITHASESDYDYICFCAGTNGWIRLKDGNGQVRFIRADDFLKAANQAAADHGYESGLVSGCYMVCAGENHNKGHALEIRMDSAALARHIFQQLSVNELKRLLGDHQISLQDLINMLTDNPDFEILNGNLPDDFLTDLGLEQDWWASIIRKLIEETDPSLLPAGSSFPDIGTPFGEDGNDEKKEAFIFSPEEFIQWLIDHGYISPESGGTPTNGQIFEWITEYLPEYLNSFSGEILFNVERIVTKQLRNTACREVSRFQNVGYPECGGTHKWIVSTNGFPSAPSYGGARSGVTLAQGTTTVQAFERVRQIYENAVTYDYTEEWILEPLDFVIFRKTVQGQLAGVDGAEHDQNTVYFSTTLGPMTEQPAGTWSFTTDEDEFGQNLSEKKTGSVIFGTVTTIMSKFGYWINGIPSGSYSLNDFSVLPAAGDSYSYRIQ